MRDEVARERRELPCARRGFAPDQKARDEVTYNYASQPWLAVPLLAGHLGCLALPAATFAVAAPILMPICSSAR